MIHAVVFDLDGTLVDSAGDLQAAANAMLDGLSAAPLDRETTIRFIGRGVPVLVARALAHRGLAAEGPPFDAALAAFRAHYDAHSLDRTAPYPGAQSALAGLARMGLGLGLCTNKPEAPARAICAALGLGPFGALVGGDSLPVRKPDPAPLIAVLDGLGVAARDALYVGDSETDWQTARAAGVPYVHCTYGYQRGEIAGLAPRARIGALDEIEGLI